MVSYFLDLNTFYFFIEYMMFLATMTAVFVLLFNVVRLLIWMIKMFKEKKFLFDYFSFIKRRP